MKGYAGSLLYVDLTSGRIQVKPLDLEFARKNIGGLGFGTRIFLDLIKDAPPFDALSAHNPFVLMTGPLTGCGMDATARWSVCSKSPLTGFWGDANVGGHFGARLKMAGYDGIVITGAAEDPVYLFINDQQVELKDASPYWGKDVYTVTDALTKGLRAQSPKPGQVLTIGPAGENQVRFANLINKKGHAAGRTGLGAVWGSKKIKAIYVAGSGKVDIAHPEKLKALRSELKEIYAESIYISSIKSAGTPAHLDVGIITGDIPFKNWQMSDWEKVDDLGPASIEAKIHAGDRTCYACTVACKKNAEVKAGPFKTQKGPGPEYETVAAFGTMCLNADIESVAKANEICNRYGMDTISCGSTIAFAIDCFENGLLTTQETDGLELRWGNAAAIVTLAEKIGKKEGFGALLAEGSAKAAQRIGKGASRFLTTVKGLEAPMHDPRNAHGFGLAYGVSPRGACHEASLVYEIEGGAMYVPELPELADDLPEGSESRAKLNVACQDYGMFFSHCAIFCNLGAAPLNATQAVAMLNHVTGFDYTLEEVMEIGRRVWYLKRGLTNLFGARAKDDRLPPRIMTPMTEGPTEGSVPDMELMLTEFYKLRGLNEEGIPQEAVLRELGLETLADLFYRKQGS
ncbi:Tungsten-containing aldehyde:ferredoxin oxidoreductase (EC [Olavius algarvensis associated proteobacterium Delta 3]|nr:Tungsten-containing aldehyde:ferredoxin oxidoreductase (EC [Olavius algarvensis associated proteobacterium Delta 3]CAB5158550.1 Tungsten-containing aldehyde:ferredoxin oxidoreductase (EC [Olavius algarvensis associated proteobacterium Delta 3]